MSHNEEETREMASDARAFLNSKAYGEIMARMRANYVAELIQADVGSLTAASAHASMKVLETFAAQLKALTTDELFLNKTKSR